MPLPPLEQSILRTVVFFDLLDYPLTATEVWRWLHKPDVPAASRSLIRVAELLEASPYLRPHIQRVEGFYFLTGREALVPQRKRRNNRVDAQMHKTIRIAKLLRLIPSIRLIGVYSSLAFGNVKETSDIDLFVICRKNTIWLTRFFAAGILKLLRKRPDMRTTKDRFCLSFFITDDALNIERAAFGAEDLGFQYYMQMLLPIYDPDHMHEEFRASNPWLEETFPNGVIPDRFTFEVGRPRWVSFAHRVFEMLTWPIFNPAYDWYCSLQLKILPDKLKSIANIDSRVIITDTMLKFHDKDTRHRLRRQWLERLNTYV